MNHSNWHEPKVHEGANVEAASDDDKAWFAAHPDRTFRLRRTIPTEFGGKVDASRMLTIVKQLTAGVRVRHAVKLGTSADLDGAIALVEYGEKGIPGDAFAEALWFSAMMQSPADLQRDIERLEEKVASRGRHQ